MEKPNKELSGELLERAHDHLEERIQEKFTFRDFKKFVKKHGRELGTGNEKPEKETLHPSPQTLDSAKKQRRSRRLLIFVALLCVVLGFFLLTIMFLMKPEERNTQLVGAQVRFPIKFIEKEGEPKTSGVVAEEAMGEKPLEGSLPQEEEPIASEPSGPSTIIGERQIGSKKLFIVGRKEVREEEGEAKVAEGEGKGPEEEGGSQVVVVEKAKVPATPEGKLQAGRYTVNVASFRDKRNTDRLMRELEEKGYEVFVEKANIPQKGVWYRVAVGRFPSRREAQAFARGLKERDGINSFVRKLKEAKQ
jgi:cell division protein FtsN